MENKPNHTIKIQQHLNEMLKTLTQILDQNNVPYYAVGGTLLGAVRHKGFIPWDDDVDISIPRKDYEAFIKKANTLLPNHLRLESHHTTPDFPHLFAKIYDTRTTMIENFTQPLIRGVYIDVFPLDGISAKQSVQYKNTKKMRFYIKIYRRCFTLEARSSSLIKRLTHKAIVPIVKLLTTKEKILSQIENLYSQVNWEEAEYITNYFGAWRLKEVQPKSWYEKRKQFKFNDYTIWGPEKHDYVLEKLYGKYTELPPKEKRCSHHKIKFIDLETPYANYIKEKNN